MAGIAAGGRTAVRHLGLCAAGLAAALGLGPAGGPAVAAPKVVASIKPVHSLVAGVMEGVGEPDLLVEGGGSPHTYSLRPSEARSLHQADIVFWIGEGMESFLAKPLAALAGRAKVIALAEAPGIELLGARAGGAWDNHEHEEHEEHGEPAEPEDHDHAPGAYNLHIWLDPHNAQQIVRAVARALSERDPDNAAAYRRNGQAVLVRLDGLDAELSDSLRGVRDVPYVVFHDAYQHLERRYGLNALGSITVSPERPPGAKRLSEIRKRILDTGAACVFSEPQFEPALIQTILEGTRAKAGVLDPLGAALAAGPDAYFDLMRALADSLIWCLSEAR